MNNRNYRTPPIVWLKMTDYTHGWLQRDLGGAARIGDHQVVCPLHLPGVKEVFRMESAEDGGQGPVGNAISAARRNRIVVGLGIDRQATEEKYGVTEEQLKLYAPVECPAMCMNRDGVLRPWTLETCLGREQASALQRLLRSAFWDAVDAFDREYAVRMNGEKYPAVEMIEAFCTETGTSEVHIDAMRREWQRRVKRKNN